MGHTSQECIAGSTDDRSRGNIFIYKYTVFCGVFLLFFFKSQT